MHVRSQSANECMQYKQRASKHACECLCWLNPISEKMFCRSFERRSETWTSEPELIWWQFLISFFYELLRKLWAFFQFGMHGRSYRTVWVWKFDVGATIPQIEYVALYGHFFLHFFRYSFVSCWLFKWFTTYNVNQLQMPNISVQSKTARMIGYRVSRMDRVESNQHQLRWGWMCFFQVL